MVQKKYLGSGRMYGIVECWFVVAILYKKMMKIVLLINPFCLYCGLVAYSVRCCCVLGIYYFRITRK